MITFNKHPGWSIYPQPPDKNGLVQSVIYFSGEAVAESNRAMTMEELRQQAKAFIEKYQDEYEQRRDFVTIA